jgi:hypothetical protein
VGFWELQPWLLLAIVYAMLGMITALFSVPFFKEVFQGDEDAPAYNYERLVAGILWPITLSAVFALGAFGFARGLMRWLFTKS